MAQQRLDRRFLAVFFYANERWLILRRLFNRIFGKTPNWVLPSVIIVAFFAGYFAIKVIFQSPPESTPAEVVHQVKATPRRPLISRDEFKDMIIQKTEEEIINTLGSPDSTTDSDVLTLWYYKHRTYDPVTGNADDFAQIDMVKWKSFMTIPADKDQPDSKPQVIETHRLTAKSVRFF